MPSSQDGTTSGKTCVEAFDAIAHEISFRGCGGN